MASEYLKWKYRDVKPREKKELTPAEKRKTWWYYHKWRLAAGIVLVLAGAGILRQVLGVGRVEPDFQFAYVGAYTLPDDTIAALEENLSALGADQNGDGQTAVSIRQYPLYNPDAQAAAAAQIQLMADLNQCDSTFFLLEDPERFQQDFHILCRLDGSLPEDGDRSADGTYLAWTACPLLATAEPGEYAYELLGETVRGSSNELASGLYLARRGFWTEKTAPYPEGCEALWNSLTEGAIS